MDAKLSGSKEAKIVKLNRITGTQQASTSNKIYINKDLNYSIDSFESSSSAASSEVDESERFIAKMVIIKDYEGDLVYGDLKVATGEYVNVICDSNRFYFVQNSQRMQGFVPKEICVDFLTLRNAHDKKSFYKITSL